MINVEEAIIYRLINNPGFRHKAHVLLCPEYFSDEVIRGIFKKFQRLEEWDEVAFANTLERREQERVSEILANSFFGSTSDSDHPIRALIRGYKANQIEYTLRETKRLMLEGVDLAQIVEEINRLQGISEETSYHRIGEQCQEYLKGLEDPAGSTFETPFTKLNTITRGGLKRKHTWVVGGYTSHGKSMVAKECFWYWLKAGHKVAYFSSEMPACEIIGRIVEGHIGVKADRPSEEVEKAVSLLSAFSPLIFDTVIDLNGIKAQSRAIKAGNGLDIIIVDFIQNIETGRVAIFDEMRAAIRELQTLAKELNIGVLVFSQLSNDMARELRDQVRRSADEVPFVAYKGAGEIGAAVDLGAIIYKETDRDFLFYVAKNRHGKTGYFRLRFDERFTVLREVEE